MKQKGFTLIELLVAMGIGTVCLGAIVTSIFVVVRGTIDVRNETAALADIENAAHWLTRDIVMGQVTDLRNDTAPVSTANMTWNDLAAEGKEEEISHYVAYTYSGTELRREYDSANNTIIVGRNLTDVQFSIDGSLVTVTLTASWDGTPRNTVTRTYVTQMRVKEE